MSIYEVLTFQDIYNSVLEELKYQKSDTVAVNRIKRDINAIYIQEVAEYNSRWKWMYGSTTVRLPAAYQGGTVSVTPGSTAATLSATPSASLGSFQDYRFSIEGESEVYTITTHTAGSTSLTLDRDFNGTVNATAAYSIWRDWLALPTDCDETVEAYHNLMNDSMEGLGFRREYNKIQRRNPKASGYPKVYSTGEYYDPSPSDDETESDRYRKLYLHPAIYSSNVNLNIDYKKELVPLEDDDDEPIIPIGDRMVLVYGALSRSWAREGNLDMMQYNQNLFQNKLARMAGKSEDSQDKPSITMRSAYIGTKRARAGRKRGAASLLEGFGSSGGGFADIKYVDDITINGGTLTADLTVQAGITIDGRDISEDGADLDAHIAASTSVHGVTGPVVGAVDTQTLTNKTIDADNNTISNLEHGAEVDDPSSGVHGVTGDVVGTTDTQTLTNKTIDADSNTISNLAHGAEVDDPTSGVHGVAGSVVGTTDTQTLTNKSINSDNNTITNIVNADIKAAAAIELSKLEALTASRALESDGSGEIVASAVTSTELNYLDGVTSGVQAQLDSKVDEITGTDNALVRNDGTSGAIQDSGIIVDDSDAITGASQLDVDNVRLDGNTVSSTSGDLNLDSASGVIVVQDSDEIRFEDDAGGEYIGLTAPSTISSSVTFVLPEDGTADQVLATNGSGVLSFVDAPVGAQSITTVSTTYTILSGDDVILASATADYTITLPTAVGATGKVYKIIRTNNSLGNDITLDANASETIGGSTTVGLFTIGETWEIISDGSNWQVLNHKTETAWASYTPSLNITANGPTPSGKWRRVGDSIEVEARISFGGGGSDATAILLGIPTSTIDTAKIVGGTGTGVERSLLGHARIIDGGGYHLGAVAYASTTQVSALGDDGLGAWTGASASGVTVSTNDDMYFRFTVPITGWDA